MEIGSKSETARIKLILFRKKALTFEMKSETSRLGAKTVDMKSAITWLKPVFFERESETVEK